ncbi:hypothetical protein V8C86DRAFT_2522254 [Haematococcus lacustris]
MVMHGEAYAGMRLSEQCHMQSQPASIADTQAHYLPQRATPVAPAAEQQDSQVSEAQQQQAGQGALAGARHGADIVVAAGTPRPDLTSCSRDELVTQVQTMQAIVSKLTDELRHAKQERTKGMSLFIKLKSVLAARESMQFSAASVTASHPTPVVESGEADAPEGWGAGQPRGSIGDEGHHPGYRAAPGATGHSAAFTTLGSAVSSALNAGAALHPSCIRGRQGFWFAPFVEAGPDAGKPQSMQGFRAHLHCTHSQAHKTTMQACR